MLACFGQVPGPTLLDYDHAAGRIRADGSPQYLKRIVSSCAALSCKFSYDVAWASPPIHYLLHAKHPLAELTWTYGAIIELHAPALAGSTPVTLPLSHLGNKSLTKLASVLTLNGNSATLTLLFSLRTNDVWISLPPRDPGV